jgi:hypothetical protein
MVRQKSFHKNKNIFTSYILKIVMVMLLIIAVWKKDWLWVFGCILGILLSMVPSALKRNYNITLPWVLDLLIALALFLHIGGGVLNAYHIIPGYDTITHFVSSVFVAFLAFVVIYILDEYWEGLHMDKYAMAFVVVVTTMAMGVVWEFNEWATDLIFGTNEQWGLNDTMKDLLVDTIAGVVMGLAGVSLMKRGSLKDMTKDFGEQVNFNIIQRHRK